MRNLKLNLITLLLLALPMLVSAQSSKKDKVVTIESSIQCGMCTNRLDKMFSDYWAVKDVDYDLENQTVTVTYNPKKTNVDEIRERIAATGYDADDVDAKVDAYMDLPKCCQKGSAKQHH